MSRFTKRDKYGHAYTNETICDRGMTSEDGVHFEKHYFENGTSAYDGKPIDRLCELEDKIEQGDVVEVRHGYWKDRYENKYANHYYECFVCGGAALDGIKNNGLGNPESIQVLSDFCPHCGAKMDGERREGNDYSDKRR